MANDEHIAILKGGVERWNDWWKKENPLSGRNVKTYEVDLSGADLKCAELASIELKWADLRGADLTDAELNRADLTDANLSGSHLRDASPFNYLACVPTTHRSVNLTAMFRA